MPVRAPLAALSLLLLLAGGCDDPAATLGAVERVRAIDRPNVVLLVVDTLRADRLEPYGETRKVSPEIARWASRGIVFERALAQSSWTKVSMASLVTSLWPRSHGVREPNDALADGATTLAEMFRDAGYRTYAVQSNGWLEQTFGFHQGFERYMFPHGGGSKGFKPMIWPHADNVYLEAERLIESHDASEPFLLYLHFMDVHEYASPPEFQKFGRGNEGAYVASIAWVDEVIERLRGKLDDEGLLDRTLMVLASDHGETFGENGFHGHARNVLSAVLHVPLVIRLPFAVEPIRVAAQVRNLDIAPTLLDLAGLPVPETLEGRSLVPLIEAAAAGGPRGEDLPSFAALTALLYRDAVIQDSVSDAAWTFARDAGEDGRERLFDRGVDPGENVDLVEIEREQAARMRAVLDEHLAVEAVPGAVESDVRIDPGLAQKLRALGYMQ